ncbi:MAG: CoA pyrophosphatase, partial [Candidatus Nezhaarchaeales archaeon]
MWRPDVGDWLSKELRKLLNPIEAVPPLLPPVAAVVALLSQVNGLAILLIKRRERAGDPWSGQVALPGGFMSAGDSSPLEAALRELREEVGIRLRREEVLGALSTHAPLIRPEVKVVPYVAYSNRAPEVILGSEVEAARWFPLASFKFSKVNVELMGGRREEVDALLADGWVVWGLTYRIISELLDRLRLLLEGLSTNFSPAPQEPSLTRP